MTLLTINQDLSHAGEPFWTFHALIKIRSGLF